MKNKKLIPKNASDVATEIDMECVDLEIEIKRLKGLLEVAICPNVMNGCQNGIMPNPYGEMERCQWCYEKKQALKGD